MSTQLSGVRRSQWSAFGLKISSSGEEIRSSQQRGPTFSCCPHPTYRTVRSHFSHLDLTQLLAHIYEIGGIEQGNGGDKRNLCKTRNIIVSRLTKRKEKRTKSGSLKNLTTRLIRAQVMRPSLKFSLLSSVIGV